MFSPLIGQFFDTIIAHQLIKSGYIDSKKSMSWKVLENCFDPLNTTRAQHLTWALCFEVIRLDFYLTIIPRARVGYEMIDSQRGA